MVRIDYYKILQLNNKATQDDIKKAYRSLAKKYHPDANPGNKQAEETFKKISEAYAVLSDKTQKENYDRIMSGGAPSEHEPESQPRQAYRPRPNVNGSDFFGQNSIFEDFFGYDPKSGSPDLKTKNDKVRPMKTNEAFQAIFGKRKF
jgi:DnaJ-class molecular chaperone